MAGFSLISWRGEERRAARGAVCQVRWARLGGGEYRDGSPPVKRLTETILKFPGDLAEFGAQIGPAGLVRAVFGAPQPSKVPSRKFSKLRWGSWRGRSRAREAIRRGLKVRSSAACWCSATKRARPRARTAPGHPYLKVLAASLDQTRPLRPRSPSAGSGTRVPSSPASASGGSAQ